MTKSNQSIDRFAAGRADFVSRRRMLVIALCLLTVVATGSGALLGIFEQLQHVLQS